ncbi:PaaI family thioesterase [Psychrobacter sp. van23A]|uniref:PaaI family thioesterase n=1 Tax=Psychrobacter TaxID=497 RepID=UPI0027B9F581|nr:PaaI family thioesterase [Psychrobacter sp. van23A]WLW67505.1 PaaI family thioesterase [Psychrobacter sp. van23A]
MNVEETIATWEAEETRIREKLGDADVIPLSDLTTRSGMDIFNAMFAGELPHPPIGLTLDYTPIHMEKGIAVFQGRPKRHHYNPLGTVHGGWFCTLLDSAVGCAVHTLLPAGKTYTTLEIKVNMVRALTVATPLVRAEGKVIHAGRRTATAEGKIVGPDGKLYAHATTTCIILDV